MRSGKSAFAQRRARESGKAVTFVATATANDQEMAQRIARHRAERPRDWRLVEEPFQLADVLKSEAAEERCIVVDCLTLWLTNLLGAEAGTDGRRLAYERRSLLETLSDLPGLVILVSNEVGMGIVPLGELSRRFCDESGRLHQDLAALCDRVILTVAGLPHVLKGDPL